MNSLGQASRQFVGALAPLGDSQFLSVLAWLLLIAVALAGILATIPRRFPGPLGGERPLLDATAPRRFLGLFVGAFVTAATIAAVGLLLMPPRPAVRLVLHSRARPSTAPPPPQSFLPASSMPGLDFGPPVDDALNRLASMGAADWPTPSPNTRRAIAQACIEAIRACPLRPLGPDGRATLPRPAPRLPRWVTESTEISVAQLLCARERVSGLYILNGPRHSNQDGWLLAQASWSVQKVHLATPEDATMGRLNIRRIGGATAEPEADGTGIVVVFSLIVDGSPEGPGPGQIDVQALAVPRGDDPSRQNRGALDSWQLQTIPVPFDARDRRVVTGRVRVPLPAGGLARADVFVRDPSTGIVSKARRRLAPQPPPRLACLGPHADGWVSLLRDIAQVRPEASDPWARLRADLADAGMPVPRVASQAEADFVLVTSVEPRNPDRVLLAVARTEGVAASAIATTRDEGVRRILPDAPAFRTDSAPMEPPTSLSISQIPLWVHTSTAPTPRDFLENDRTAVLVRSHPMRGSVPDGRTLDRSMGVPFLMDLGVAEERVTLVQPGVDLRGSLSMGRGPAATSGENGYDPAVTVGLVRAIALACARASRPDSTDLADSHPDGDRVALAGPVFGASDLSEALAMRIRGWDVLAITIIGGVLAWFALTILRSARTSPSESLSARTLP